MIDVLDHPTRVPAAPVRHPSPEPNRDTAVVMLLPLRLFLAAGWLRAAAEKLIDPQWWNGNKLRSFLTTQHDAALPFFRPIMQNVITPGAQTVAIVLVLTQLAAGIAIAIGKPLRLALRWVVFMNVVFVVAGRVNPSAFYLVMEIVLLFAIADGTIGVRPSLPSQRTVVAAGVSAGAALALTPYIRTIEPSEVIDDPAMMLSFVGMMIAVTLVVRLAAYRTQRVTHLRRLWATWAAGWMHAKPVKAVRRDYDWRHRLRGPSFDPPRRGTAVSSRPPSHRRA